MALILLYILILLVVAILLYNIFYKVFNSLIVFQVETLKLFVFIIEGFLYKQHFGI